MIASASWGYMSWWPRMRWARVAWIRKFDLLHAFIWIQLQIFSLKKHRYPSNSRNVSLVTSWYNYHGLDRRRLAWSQFPFMEVQEEFCSIKNLFQTFQTYKCRQWSHRNSLSRNFELKGLFADFKFVVQRNRIKFRNMVHFKGFFSILVSVPAVDFMMWSVQSRLYR